MLLLPWSFRSAGLSGRQSRQPLGDQQLFLPASGQASRTTTRQTPPPPATASAPPSTTAAAFLNDDPGALNMFQYFGSVNEFPLGDPLQAHSVFLFDCDGLLLDTEPLYTQAACALIGQLNGPQLPALPPQLKLSIMGRTRLAVAEGMSQWLNQEHGIPCPAATWSTLVFPIEAELFGRGCQLLPGAQELVARLRRERKSVALATSSQRSTFEIKSRLHRESLFGHFPVIVCGDELTDSSYSKPHPKIFQIAHSRITSDPNCTTTTTTALVFEDSPNGVVAALRAGFNVIWVPGAEVRSLAGIEHLLQVIREQDCQGEISSQNYVLRLGSLEELLAS